MIDPMTELRQISAEIAGVQVWSPTARAMAQAFDDRYELCGLFDDNWQELCLAAALQVLADQIEHHWDGAECVDHLQALAAELAGDPEPITTTEPHD